MYLSPSNGSRGTAGLASTDQSSCQRLNRMAGRAGAAPSAGDVVSCPQAADAVRAPAPSKAAKTPAARSRARSMDLRDVAARELDDRRVAVVGGIGRDEDGSAGRACLG